MLLFNPYGNLKIDHTPTIPDDQNREGSIALKTKKGGGQPPFSFDLRVSYSSIERVGSVGSKPEAALILASSSSMSSGLSSRRFFTESLPWPSFSPL
jgi:hypothetical protein